MSRRLPSPQLQSNWTASEISSLKKILDGSRLQPQVAIQCSILDRFGKMLRFEIFGAFKIGDGASHFQNAVIASGREAEFGDGVFQDLFAFRSQRAVLANVAPAHLRVRVNVFVEEAAELRVARGDDAMADCFRGLRETAARQIFVRNSGHVDLNIDTVHERAGDLGHVALNLWRRAKAFAAEVIRKTAWI